MENKVQKPDPPLSIEQQSKVDKLSQEDLRNIDNALMSVVCNRWRKVARVIDTTMSSLPNRVSGIPDVFYSQRVQLLVEKGHLESQGNSDFMAFSEVRLPRQNFGKRDLFNPKGGLSKTRNKIKKIEAKAIRKLSIKDEEPPDDIA